MGNKITNECLTSGEIRQLEAADAPGKWLRVLDSILVSRGGQYPSDWREKTLVLFLKLLKNL